MGFYEFHITLVDDQLPKKFPENWKVTKFNNLSPDGKIIRSETLLSHDAELNNDVDAIYLLSNTIEQYSIVHQRVKIETNIRSAPMSTLYYEAHMKLKQDVDFSHYRVWHDILKSHNPVKDKYWCTLRYRNHSTLVTEYENFIYQFGNLVEERDVESVIFDSNISLDYEWMGSRL
jgi:hypothetical protein